MAEPAIGTVVGDFHYIGGGVNSRANWAPNDPGMTTTATQGAPQAGDVQVGSGMYVRPSVPTMDGVTVTAPPKIAPPGQPVSSSLDPTGNQALPVGNYNIPAGGGLRSDVTIPMRVVPAKDGEQTAYDIQKAAIKSDPTQALPVQGQAGVMHAANGVLADTVPMLAGAYAAGTQGLANLFGGKPPERSMSEAYDGSKEAYNAYFNHLTKAAPVTSTVAEIAGGIASPGMKGAGGWAAAAPTMGGKMFRSGVVGAGYGGLAGAGMSEPGQELQGGLSGGVTGATIGAIAPPLLSTAAKAIQPVVRPVQNALSQVTGGRVPSIPIPLNAPQKALVPGFTGASATEDPAAFLANMQRGVLPIAAGNDTLAQVAENIAHSAGPGRPALLEAIAARREGEGDRILQAAQDHLGVSPVAARGDIKQMVEDGRAAAGPVFDSVLQRNNPTALMTPKLAELLQEPEVKSAMGVAQRLLGSRGQVAGIKIDPATGSPALENMQPVIEMQPTPEAWDVARQMLNKRINLHPDGSIMNSGAKGTENALLQHWTQGLTGELAGDANGAGAAIPGYRGALDQAGDYLKVDSAYRNAKGKLLGRMPAADFADWHATLGSQPERDAAKAAAANDLLEAFDNNRLQPGQFDKAGVAKRMQTLFGDQAPAFLDAMDQFQHERQIYSRMVGGSDTARRLDLKNVYGSAQGPLNMQNAVEWAAPALLAMHEPAAGGALLAAKAAKAFANRGTKATMTPWEVPKLNGGMGQILGDPDAMTALLNQQQANAARQAAVQRWAGQAAARSVPLLSQRAAAH